MRRWTALGISCALAAAVLSLASSTTGSALPLVASTGQVGSSIGGAAEEEALAAAMVEARNTGMPVVVDSMTSATELTTALPTGSFSTELAIAPQRAEHEGQWVPVDTSLTADGSWLVPVASDVEVRFGRGGDNRISQVMAADGAWISETWPHGDLPTPTVEGSTATYAEVLPGVDLKLTATSVGMASVFVVKNKEAANAEVMSALGARVEGADLTQDRGLVAAAAGDGVDGTVIAPPPLWWDSSDGATFMGPGADNPLQPVEHELTEEGVSLDVAATIVGQDVEYPIFVDPEWSQASGTYAWYTDREFPDQQYVFGDVDGTLRVGRSDPYRSSMFLQFGLQQFAGKQILAAQVSVRQTKVLSTPSSPLGMYSYGIKSSPFTWNQEQADPGQWGKLLDSKDDRTIGFVGWNATSAVAARAGQAHIQFGFKAVDGASNSSRRHFSRDGITLKVEWNTPPNTPTSMVITSPPRACGTGTAPARLNATSVSVSVTQTDPDNGNVDTNFYLANASSLGTILQSKAAGIGAQGTKAVTFTNLVPGTKYAWRARGSDHLIDGVSFSPWCYFVVDTTPPAAPTVTTPAASFTVGTGISVQASGASDVAGYMYWITPTQLTSTAPAVPVPSGVPSKTGPLPACNTTLLSPVRWACRKDGAATTLTVAPTDRYSTLWVAAYDGAGNVSTAKGLKLYQAAGTPAGAADLNAGHAWQTSAMQSPLPSKVPDSNPWVGSAAIQLILPPGASKTSTDLPDPPASSPVISTNYSSAADEAYTSKSPIDATKSFTVSIWVKADNLASFERTIVLQTGPGGGAVALRATADNKFAFCLGAYGVETSSKNVSSNCAVGGSVVAGKWQLVTGIWDATNKQIRLLVGNSITPVASAAHAVAPSGDWTANGPLIIAPAPGSLRFVGLATNLVIVPGVINSNQLAQLNGFMLPFS